MSVLSKQKFLFFNLILGLTQIAQIISKCIDCMYLVDLIIYLGYLKSGVHKFSEFACLVVTFV